MGVQVEQLLAVVVEVGVIVAICENINHPPLRMLPDRCDLPLRLQAQCWL
jgi:hypothetical protein